MNPNRDISSWQIESLKLEMCKRIREMTTSVQQTLDGLAVNMPKSYTREFKLEVVKFYHENNLYQMAKGFSLNTNLMCTELNMA